MNPENRASTFRVLTTSGLLFLISVELLVARNVDIYSSLAITSLVFLQVFGGAAVFVSTRVTSASAVQLDLLFRDLSQLSPTITSGFQLSGFR